MADPAAHAKAAAPPAQNGPGRQRRRPRRHGDSWRAEGATRKRDRSVDHGKNNGYADAGADADVDARQTRRMRPSAHGEQKKAGLCKVDARQADAGGAQIELPYSSRPLTRSDLQAFEPLFVHYLGIQKQKNAYDMDKRELRGRWKRFVGKWNRNELAEGWYDPELFARISTWKREEEEEEKKAQEEALRRCIGVGLDPDKESRSSGKATASKADDSDDYGPTLPQSSLRRRQAGAKMPSLQDLALQDELIEESRKAEREALRVARKADRAEQKERLEELVPRAEPGTKERKQEKRREINDKMRQFRDKSPGMESGNDKDLIGGGDSLEEYKQMKAKERRRKSERQVRKEAMDRAKQEIMESKRRAWQQREEGTVNMLRELAKQRFGSTGEG